MKRYLSIDWDYFIDATMEQRTTLFPDSGNENLPPDVQQLIWNSRYEFNDMNNIGVIEEIETVSKVLKRHKNDLIHALADKRRIVKVYVYDSHKFMYDLVMQTTRSKEKFEVYNIDFHHDLYFYRTTNENVNCGNWGSILKEDRPNMKYYWIKREDSDTKVLGGEAEYLNCDMSTIEKLDFDYIYICRSSMWSPPHLDQEFIKLANSIYTPMFSSMPDMLAPRTTI